LKTLKDLQDSDLLDFLNEYGNLITDRSFCNSASLDLNTRLINFNKCSFVAHLPNSTHVVNFFNYNLIIDITVGTVFEAKHFFNKNFDQHLKLNNYLDRAFQKYYSTDGWVFKTSLDPRRLLYFSTERVSLATIKESYYDMEKL